jgi:photosystem I subunit 2
MLLEGELNQLLAVSPKFGGSTGGWLQAAETEEKYAITWASKKEQIFEMPTSGAAIMQKSQSSLSFKKRTVLSTGYSITYSF